MAEPLDADALFALPLDEFTSARNALAKRLQARGDEKEATAIKSLRKPSVTAWAVNRLAHDDAQGIKRLLKATDDVAGASDASSLRRATATRARILGQLVDAAGSILDDAGRAASRAQLDKITQTLQTGSTSAEHRDDLVHGRLRRDLEPSGFGEIREFAPAGKTIDHRAQAARRKAEELAKKAAAAEERAAKLEARAQALEDTAAEARAAADKAREEAARARDRAEQAGDGNR
jgi:hypothetical protein